MVEKHEPNDTKTPPSGGDGSAQGLEVFTIDEVSDFKATEARIEGVMSTGALIILVGQSGSGKTFYALEMAASLSDGSDFFGNKVKQSSVLYVDLEGRLHMRNRIRALKQHKNRDSSKLSIAFGDLDLATESGQAILTEKSASYDVVIIDTFRASHSANENDSGEMASVLTFLLRLTWQGKNVILVHHSGKQGESENSKIRGSSAIRAAANSVIFLSRRGDSIKVECDKAKDYAAFSTFGLKTRTIDLDDGSGSSLVLELDEDWRERADHPNAPSAPKVNKNHEFIIKLICNAGVNGIRRHDLISHAVTMSETTALAAVNRLRAAGKVEKETRGKETWFKAVMPY